MNQIFVVIDLETTRDDQRVLGQYFDTVEGSVRYYATDGTLRTAPDDCVSVRVLAEVRAR